MSSQSSSYVLCPGTIDSDNRTTLTASCAIETQLQSLCLKEFPGGLGSWVCQRKTACLCFFGQYDAFANIRAIVHIRVSFTAQP